MIGKLLRVTLAMLLIAVAVAAAHVFPGLTGSFVEAEVRNALHLVGFAVVAAVLYELTPGGVVVKAIAAIAGPTLIGLAAEYVQMRVGRTFDLQDVGRDAVGASGYVVARLLWHRAGRVARWRVLPRVLGVVVVAAMFVPLAFWGSMLASYHTRMPVLIDPGVKDDIRLVSPFRSELRVTRRAGSASDIYEIVPSSNRPAGVLINTVVSDWTPYRYFAMRLSADGIPETRVRVELLDGLHGDVRPWHLIGSDVIGTDPVEIRLSLEEQPEGPEKPPLDLGDIKRIYIIGRAGSESATLYLDRIWLE